MIVEVRSPTEIFWIGVKHHWWYKIHAGIKGNYPKIEVQNESEIDSKLSELLRGRKK